MRHGNIEHVGDPASLYETPATDFVADFIGETNFVKLPADRIEGGKAVMTFPASNRLTRSSWLARPRQAPMGNLASGRSTSRFRKVRMRD